MQWVAAFAGKDHVAVSINNLRKEFTTTDGGVKAAVDGLDLNIYKGQITALLGRAHKTLRIAGAANACICLF